MRAVVQRVSWAQVTVRDEVVGRIGTGLLVLLGVGRGDTGEDAELLARKIVGLRIFEDQDQNMNRALAEVGGALLVVSQFTLYGDCRKGRRPSFVGSAPAERASALYAGFLEALRAEGVPVAAGLFQAMMAVELVNDGPVTLILDRE